MSSAAQVRPHVDRPSAPATALAARLAGLRPRRPPGLRRGGRDARLRLPGRDGRHPRWRAGLQGRGEPRRASSPWSSSAPSSATRWATPSASAGGPSSWSCGPLRNGRRASPPRSTSSTAGAPSRSSSARFSAFLRAVVPGLAGLSSMHYRTFLWANAAGGLCWGVLYVLLGYFVGPERREGHGHRVRRRPRAHPRGDRGARRAPLPQGQGGVRRPVRVVTGSRRRRTGADDAA